MDTYCICSVKMWVAPDSCRQTKEFFPINVEPKGWESLLSLRRSELRNILQMITGHGNIAQYRHAMGKTDNPICPFCETGPETPRHLVETCPVFSAMRVRFLDGVATDLQEIIRSFRWSHLASFLEATGRLDNFSRETRNQE